MRALEQFAADCGMSIVLAGPGWGGRYGYTTADAPNCSVLGFRTQAAARRRWLTDTFGAHAAAGLIKTLSALAKANPAPEQEGSG